ncbi:calcium-binding protein [Mesorhizobium sp. M7A.F.Ca.US.011.01.1.1]|uniref:calcium-binding protein n=1 Tax=Mesorhizobium sp. M7A.F.Ca.US.011.01.1.1 TaxID=2496741 RepID=UPI000FCACB9F|nr:calcium-binding protein [Mesorhizobium sp. M7A.F.Ca.US.011.01.1.1]RUX28379.1 calcium-binding protein [Mesorhizobium sp. M7A.F.Ca.US.011.01.1.1]
MTLHYASGGSAAEIATAGFNLADVQYVSQVNALPDGMKGLVYLGEHDGVTSSFIDKVTPFIGNPDVFGFYLSDEPDPTGKWGSYATAANLKAESDWIHSHFPGAKTFITMMNLGTDGSPSYMNPNDPAHAAYNPANTGIDFYGIGYYPINNTSAPDYSHIDKMVAAAGEAGIPIDKIIPLYQGFGGGNWETSAGGKFVMPTAAQEQAMIDRWAALVPSPAFDYTYKWGTQNGDTALESASELKAFFLQHNLEGTHAPVSPPVSDPVTPPVSDPVGTPTTPPTHAGAPAPAAPAPSGSDHVFHGTRGADVFHATTGNDKYLVNNAHDKVMEAPNGGFDKVAASVSYALTAGSHVEQLSTANSGGRASINLTGNEFGQAIYGNGGANKINGGGGADKMTGYGGNDTYSVDNAHDKVVEQKGSGIDKVLASVSFALSAGSHIEQLATSKASSKAAIDLTGNEFAQTVKGNAGANKIDGGGGADKLTGHGGRDAFVFSTALGAGNVDRITDFNKAQDKIHLDHSIFAGLDQGSLSSDAFFAGKAAHDSSDHIIYNSSTGALSFDSDGVGGANQIHFASLSPHLSITASSFLVT